MFAETPRTIPDSGRLWVAACSTVIAMLATGCCVSMHRAAAITAAVESENRSRAEPSMRSAAEQRTATLLPNEVEDIRPMPACRPDYEGPCVLGTADNGRTYRIRDQGGHARLAVPIGSDARPTTRLARRGTTFLILKPQVTPRKVTSRTACECDRKPRIASATGFVHIGAAFVVDETATVDVEKVSVPVTEDQIEWTCRARLL